MPGAFLKEALPQGAETLDAEWGLLLECAKPHPDAQRLSQRLNAPLDWAALIAFAEDHSVLGLMSALLQSRDENMIPAENRESLRIWRRQYYRSFLCSGDAIITKSRRAKKYNLYEYYSFS